MAVLTEAATLRASSRAAAANGSSLCDSVESFDAVCGDVCASGCAEDCDDDCEEACAVGGCEACEAGAAKTANEDASSR